MATTNGLTRRLDALEQIAEKVRVRNLRGWLEGMSRQANMSPERTECYIARLLGLDRRIRAWLADGVSRNDIGRRCAVEIGVDPEKFVRETAEAWEREEGRAT